MPILGAVLGNLSKYMQDKKHVKPLNWTFGYWSVYSWTLLIPSVIYFGINPQEF